MPGTANPAQPTPDEAARLRALGAYHVLDTPPEDDLDRLVRLARRLFHVRAAAIALLDRERYFLKAKSGTACDAVPRDDAACDTVTLTGDAWMLSDILREPHLNCRGWDRVLPGLRFFAGVPLLAADGHQLGVFCLFDDRARDDVGPVQAEWLSELASLAMNRFEVRRLDAARRVGRHRLENLASTSPDAIVCFDDEARITFWNPGATRLFGMSVEAMLGRPFLTLLDPASQTRHAVRMHQLEAGHQEAVQPTQRLVGLHANGSPLLIDVSLSLWREEGQPVFGAIVRDLSAWRLSEERLLRLAQLDPLTALADAATFRQAVAALSPTVPAAVLLVALNGIKPINDARGTEAGDAVLRAMAHRFRLLFPESGTLGRLGGAEFAALVPECADAAECAALCRRVLHAVSEPLEVDGVRVELTGNIGIALHPLDTPANAGGLLANADLALYEAKKQGGNTFRFFVQELREAVVRRRKMEHELIDACDQGQFVLFYQPQVALDTGRVVGAEALLRWRHPVAGVLAPGEFIRILETSPSIETVGRWILTNACQQAVAWRRLHPGFRVAVNLFASQFQSDRLLQLVNDVLAETGLEAAGLELEITENTLLRPDARMMDTLQQLYDSGVSIAFDDYGTGYASLSLLKRLPITRLKIDRSFLTNLPEDAADAAVIQAILYLGAKFNLDVVAEGIETPAQAQFLREQGCALGQGYWYGVPMPAGAFAEKFLASPSGFPAA